MAVTVPALCCVSNLNVESLLVVIIAPTYPYVYSEGWPFSSATFKAKVNFKRRRDIRTVVLVDAAHLPEGYV